MIDWLQSSERDMLTLIKMDAQKLARYTSMMDLPQSSDSDMLTHIKRDAQRLTRFTNMINWPQSSMGESSKFQKLLKFQSQTCSIPTKESQLQV